MKSAVKSEDLADVTSQDIKSTPYTLQQDKTRLMNDEITWSKAWVNANLTGIGGRHSATLSWSPPSSGPTATGYNVYRSATTGGPYAEIAGGIADTSYTDFAVNPQQVWYYVVTATNVSGESSYSNEISATIPGGGVYVYPGSYEDSSTELIAAAADMRGRGEQVRDRRRTQPQSWQLAWMYRTFLAKGLRRICRT